MLALCVAGHQRFCMRGFEAHGSPGKISVALVLPGLQCKARAAKKPSAEERFWFLLSPQKEQPPRQLSGKNIT